MSKLKNVKITSEAHRDLCRASKKTGVRKTHFASLAISKEAKVASKTRIEDQ